MRVVVVGGGGREHALAHVLGRTASVVVTPGNAGMVAAGVECTGVGVDPAELASDLVVVGPDQPLVDGLADRLRAGGATVLGPGADGARIEGSKAWMKEVAAAAGVPTAAHGTFTSLAPAVAYLRSMPPPWVVKTDGLALGKGVLVTHDLAEAEADAGAKLAGRTFGDAGRTVVVEEGMSGPELSLLAVCDGRRAVALAPARDYKRALDGDAGPNTGGMGAYSPVEGVGDDLVAQVLEQFIEPTLAELRRRGIDYRGVLYAGLMLTPDGPRLVEFNARFGDPEAQVVLPRFAGDLAALLHAAASGDLDQAPPPEALDGAAVAVVLAGEGYPAAPRTGDVIEGLDGAAAIDGVTLFHAGVAAGPDGTLVSSGGRVLHVVGTAPTLAEARSRAYAAAAHITWPGRHHRTDIAAGAGGAGPG